MRQHRVDERRFQLLDDARQVLAAVNERLAPGGRDAETLDLSALGTAVATPLERIAAATDRLAREAVGVGAADALPDVKRIAEAVRRLATLVTPDAAAASAQTGSADAASAAAARTSRGGILVVDDDAANRDLLARRLVREGYQVWAAADGAAALAGLDPSAGAAVDLVLLDVMMPGLDGYEVLRRMKADPTLRDIPVLMISALDEVQSVVRCIELGAFLISAIELLADDWGELCASKKVASARAAQLVGVTRMALSPDKNLRGHFHGTAACLSALYCAERYQEIVDILTVDTIWAYKRWAAKALAAMGQKAEAIRYAESCRNPLTMESHDRCMN